MPKQKMQSKSRPTAKAHLAGIVAGAHVDEALPFGRTYGRAGNWMLVSSDVDAAPGGGPAREAAACIMHLPGVEVVARAAKLEAACPNQPPPRQAHTPQAHSVRARTCEPSEIKHPFVSDRPSKHIPQANRVLAARGTRLVGGGNYRLVYRRVAAEVRPKTTVRERRDGALSSLIPHTPSLCTVHWPATGQTCQID